ncbi:MAG: DUF732 domain-containing protein [Rhodoglobus sp.]
MEAGWYLKTADATEAHWWDGSQYTTHTSPLTGYPFAVHPDPLAGPSAPVAPPAPEPIAPPEPIVAATPPVSEEPPVEVPEELPVAEEPVVAEPVVDAAPPVFDAPPVVEPTFAPPVVEPPFTPPALTTPQFGPPEPTVTPAPSFGPPQPTTPVAGPPQPSFGAPQPNFDAPHPGYGAPQATAGGAMPPGAPTAPRTGMNKGLFWGIIGGGALILVIIIVLIANLLSSVFAVNPITQPDGPSVPVPVPSATSETTDPEEPQLPDDTGTTTREIDASTRQVFAGLVTSSIPTLANETEDSIVDGGLAVCSMFDEGQDVTAIGGILTQSGLPVTEAGLFLGYSVAVLCPEYTDSVG